MTRAIYVMTASLAILGTCIPALIHPAPRLIWNATASTPTGLYALHTIGQLHVRDLVVAWPPEPIAAFLESGGFLPKGVPLLKQVMALLGQTICRINNIVTIDGIAIGAAHERDHLGRPLPRWTGCRRLRADEVFLMNPNVPDSLDGRYFGPFPFSAIAARAVPLWTDDASQSRFISHRPGNTLAQSVSKSTHQEN